MKTAPKPRATKKSRGELWPPLLLPLLLSLPFAPPVPELMVLPVGDMLKVTVVGAMPVDGPETEVTDEVTLETRLEATLVAALVAALVTLEIEDEEGSWRAWFSTTRARCCEPATRASRLMNPIVAVAKGVLSDERRRRGLYDGCDGSETMGSRRREQAR